MGCGADRHKVDSLATVAIQSHTHHKRKQRKMDIERRFERKPFADLAYGTLFAGIIGRQCAVRAIKARAEGNKGELDDFFVTVGPFDEEWGKFPALHHHEALYDDHALELIGGYQISPSLSPDDFVPDLPLDDNINGLLIILKDNQVLLSVALIDNFKRIHRRWLDVKTGEVLLPLRHTNYIATRRWRITASVENSAPKTIFEFTVDTEGE